MAFAKKTIKQYQKLRTNPYRAWFPGTGGID
jgi:hypothetical protein